MKKYHILYLTFVFCIAQSCSKISEPVYEYGGRIVFSDNGTYTKGISLNSLKGQDFGVRCYTYSAPVLWETAAPDTKPDGEWTDETVFSCDETGNSVTGHRWKKNMNYSFFAYYPHKTAFGSGATLGTLKLSSPEQFGAPILTYTLPNNPTKISKMNKHVDLMYASNFDVNENNSSTVGLHFRHCMFGIQVVLLNLNEYTENEPHPYIQIDYLHVKLIGLKNQTMTLSMTPKGKPIVNYTPFNNSGGIDVDFEYTNAETNPADTILLRSTLNQGAYDVCGRKCDGQHLLLIPQIGDQKGIKAEITMKINGEPNPQVLTRRFPSIELEAGVRYFLGVQFIGENTNVILVAADQWIDNDGIIEFE